MPMITQRDRLRRSLDILRRERRAEAERAGNLEGITLPQIVTLRNKKMLHIAEIDQMIRQAEERIKELEIREPESGKKWGWNGGLSR